MPMPLARFEALAQRLLERTVERVLGRELAPATITAQLLRAMVDSEQGDEVANHYRVRLHPDDYARFSAQWPELEQELQAALQQVIAETGRTLSGDLAVVVQPGDDVPHREAQVVASREQPREDTTFLRHHDEEFARRIIEALDAFLIVDGMRHVPLRQPFLTIGRHVDNDVIVDHPAVSRQHAQIRWRYGHFVLYDLGSRGGITVNDQPVQEWVLRPGDLIYLSRRVPLIYAEGLESRRELADLRETNGGEETQVIPAQRDTP